MTQRSNQTEQPLKHTGERYVEAFILGGFAAIITAGVVLLCVVFL